MVCHFDIMASFAVYNNLVEIIQRNTVAGIR